MGNAPRDDNHLPTLLGVSNADGTTPVVLWADPTTHRLLVDTATSFADSETPSGTIDGSNKEFTLASTPDAAGSLQLFLNGALQAPAGEDFTLSTATTTFVNAPPNGSVLLAWYRF